MANLVGLKDFETKSSKDYKRGMVEIQSHMEQVLGDDTYLAWVMGGGRTTYRNVFAREFRAFKGVDDDMSDMLWTLFQQTWNQRYPHTRPSAYLDSLHVVTPPTQKEIDDAWVHESASSDDGRRYFGVA